MDSNPILSIIVPVYNVEQYLPKCIDSVLTQPFGDFELILVDDGSTDSSGRICDDYARKDVRIKVVHKPNDGQGPARNTGLDIARGRYISFIDSDDYISQDLYEKNMPILLNDETIDILQFPIECVVDGKETILNIPDYEAGRHLYSKKDFFTFWSNKGTGARGFVCQNIYARNLWNGVRFDKMYFEDCAIQNKLLVKAKHIYLSGYGAYKYVQRGGSILHSESIIEKSLGDFKATIPFIGNMVKYGVERELVVKCYIITLNRLIDKSYLFQDVDVFLSDYNYINSLGIKLSEVVFYCNGLLMSRIKIFLSRCIGLRNVVRLQGLKAKFKSR